MLSMHDARVSEITFIRYAKKKSNCKPKYLKVFDVGGGGGGGGEGGAINTDGLNGLPTFG